MIRKINDVAVSDYMVRRLREIEQSGRMVMGCSSCRNLTIDRLAAAGLIRVALPGRICFVTDAGRALLADESAP